MDRKGRNYIFIGGSGCGKSEISLNFALHLSKLGHDVHYFDLDMTKPLFRSREMDHMLKENGITPHYEEQFMDAPTTGGVEHFLESGDITAVLDIGGDHIGARALGQYAPLLKKTDSTVYYVINPFCAWADTKEHVEAVLCDILFASHISFEELRFVVNPNTGTTSDEETFLDGAKRMEDLLPEGCNIDFYCAKESICEKLKGSFGYDIFPLHIFLAYPWEAAGQ